MKKILKPSQIEECDYISDFLENPMPACPAVEVKIDFGYGSKYDGDLLTLHLTDPETSHLLEVIKTHGSQNFKKTLEQQHLHPDLLKKLL
jgi:hypothetical protein